MAQAIKNIYFRPPAPDAKLEPRDPANDFQLGTIVRTVDNKLWECRGGPFYKYWARYVAPTGIPGGE